MKCSKDIWFGGRLLFTEQFSGEIPRNTCSHIFQEWRVSPPGSHKPNTAIPQAYYNKVFGTKRLATETGAGQWVVRSLSHAVNSALTVKYIWLGLAITKNRIEGHSWKHGEQNVFRSSPDTNSGRKFYEQNHEHPGVWALQSVSTVEDGATSKDSKYSIGSVVNHVVLHQTILGLEAQKQLAMIESIRI